MSGSPPFLLDHRLRDEADKRLHAISFTSVRMDHAGAGRRPRTHVRPARSPCCFAMLVRGQPIRPRQRLLKNLRYLKFESNSATHLTIF